MGSSNGIHTYGLAFVDPHLHFWSSEFPPLTPAEIAAGQLSLVCSSCKNIEKLDNTSIEAGIFVANKSILRFCKHCGFSTLWKPAPGVAAQEPLASTAIQTPPSSPAPASHSPQAPAQSQATVYAEPRGAVLTLPPPPRLRPFPVDQSDLDPPVQRMRHPDQRTNRPIARLILHRRVAERGKTETQFSRRREDRPSARHC